jgi:hypothetical protein
MKPAAVLWFSVVHGPYSHKMATAPLSWTHADCGRFNRKKEISSVTCPTDAVWVAVPPLPGHRQYVHRATLQPARRWYLLLAPRAFF